jgi:hypothetical protein
VGRPVSGQAAVGFRIFCDQARPGRGVDDVGKAMKAWSEDAAEHADDRAIEVGPADPIASFRSTLSNTYGP